MGFLQNLSKKTNYVKNHSCALWFLSPIIKEVVMGYTQKCSQEAKVTHHTHTHPKYMTAVNIPVWFSTEGSLGMSRCDSILIDRTANNTTCSQA